MGRKESNQTNKTMQFQQGIHVLLAYADPESFVRGGPTLTMFFFDEGKEEPNITISRPLSIHQRNAILMAFCWLADVGPTLNALAW